VTLSLAFFVGLVLSVMALGVTAAYLGRLVSRWSVVFAVCAALFSLLAGLAALFGPALRSRFSDPEINQRGGLIGAFVYGLSYSVATVTTSAGPLLLLLTIAAAVGRPAYGAVLSLSYAIGRGVPFLLLGFFAGTVAAWISRLNRARRITEIISGVVLVVLAAYFLRLAKTL
jgi:cytochrome c-type biogenesis protein